MLDSELREYPTHWKYMNSCLRTRLGKLCTYKFHNMNSVNCFMADSAIARLHGDPKVGGQITTNTYLDWDVEFLALSNSVSTFTKPYIELFVANKRYLWYNQSGVDWTTNSWIMTLRSNSDDLVLDFGSFKYFWQFCQFGQMTIQMIIKSLQLINQDFLDWYFRAVFRWFWLWY